MVYIPNNSKNTHKDYWREVKKRLLWITCVDIEIYKWSPIYFDLFDRRKLAQLCLDCFDTHPKEVSHALCDISAIENNIRKDLSLPYLACNKNEA